MPPKADDLPLDAELVAADAEHRRRLEDAADFARRLNAACGAFEVAYAEVRQADIQLRERRIDWHFVLATLNAKFKEASSAVRLYEPDVNLDSRALVLRRMFVRMVESAAQPGRRDEAVAIIQGLNEAEQDVLRKLALQARHNLFYGLAEAVALRAAVAFPETYSEIRAKFVAASDAHLIGPCEEFFRSALLGLLNGTVVTRKAIEDELQRLGNDTWTKLVRALLAAHPKPMKTSELQTATEVSDPGGGLARARDQSSILRHVIVVPGAKGKRGYRLQFIAD